MGLLDYLSRVRNDARNFEQARTANELSAYNLGTAQNNSAQGLIGLNALAQDAQLRQQIAQADRLRQLYPNMTQEEIARLVLSQKQAEAETSLIPDKTEIAQTELKGKKAEARIGAKEAEYGEQEYDLKDPLRKVKIAIDKKRATMTAKDLAKAAIPEKSSAKLPANLSGATGIPAGIATAIGNIYNKFNLKYGNRPELDSAILKRLKDKGYSDEEIANIFA